MHEDALVHTEHQDIKGFKITSVKQFKFKRENQHCYLNKNVKQETPIIMTNTSKGRPVNNRLLTRGSCITKSTGFKRLNRRQPSPLHNRNIIKI